MFENAKVGDRVWDFVLGWGTIEKMDYDNDPCIVAVKFDNAHFNTYMLDGRTSDDLMPTLFWNKIKFEIPEKPFQLKEFVYKNLKPKEFKYGCNNFYFKYSWVFHRLECCNTMQEEFGCLYFEEIDSFTLNVLNEKFVLMEKLSKTFKELGWI